MKLWTRVLQNASMTTHMFMMLPARVVVTSVMLYCLVFGSIVIQLLVVAYVVFRLNDLETPYKGGKRCDWFRGSRYFKLLANYFPFKLVQTAELPPDHNYLAVCHPHGVWFLAFTLAFAADVSRLEFRKKLKTFFTTLNYNFQLPLAREYLLASGMIAVEERSLLHVLSAPEGGNVVALLPGGSAEATLAEPGKYRILLRSRKGFCRVALKTGSHLVPTFAFGEVDCWKIKTPTPESLLGRLQFWVKRQFGFIPLLFMNPESNLPTLPARKAITIVMGSPIPVDKKESPSKEEIEDLHHKYVESIQRLFEGEKHKYLNDASNVKLIVD